MAERTRRFLTSPAGAPARLSTVPAPIQAMTDETASVPYSGPQRVVSGVQPSGALHLGNYLGALKKFVVLQDQIPTFIFVADLHAITQWQDPKLLANQTDPRGGDAMDRIINGLAKVTPRA